METIKQELGGIVPARVEGGVPVFEPTMQEFRDFEKYVSQIERFGMQAGIVKVVPPKQWARELGPPAKARIDNVRIKKPIRQVFNGMNGVYTVQNVEQRKSYSISDWEQYARKMAPRNKDYQPQDFTDELCDRLEHLYWQTIGESTPVYGADTLGSLFDPEFKVWNVADLPSILKRLPQQLPGVNDAYLYCGAWKASFAWHLEDMDLPSINYIHFGAPKQWYSIPQASKDKFFKVMRSLFPSEYRRCHEFLRHKTFLASPAILHREGIVVNSIVHREGEFIITWPYGYHAGFNYGYNCAESVNFGTSAWLPLGKASDYCKCVTDSVRFDASILELAGSGSSSGNSSDLASIKASKPKISPRAARVSKIARPVVIKQKEVLPDTYGDFLPGIYPSKSCVLCSVQHPELLLYPASDSRSRAHELCATLIPETWMFDGAVHGLKEVSRQRFRLNCKFCKQKTGACVQCCFSRCAESFHPTCAFAAGCAVEGESIWCKRHRRLPTCDTVIDPETLLPGDCVRVSHYRVYDPLQPEQKLMPLAQSGCGIVISTTAAQTEVVLAMHPGFGTFGIAELSAIIERADSLIF